MSGITRPESFRLASLRKQLSFLTGKYRLLIFWPILAIALGLTGWHLLLSQLQQQQENLEAKALQDAAIFSKSYAAHLTRTLETLDQIALHVKYEWQLTNGQLRLEDAREAGLFPPDTEFYVAIANRDGHVITSTYPLPKMLDISDRPYFQEQLNATSDKLHISGPSVGRVTKRQVLFLSRRLQDRSGNFAGVVSLSMTLDYFTASYDHAIFGMHGMLGIVGTDQVVRVTRSGNTVHAPGAELLVAAPKLGIGNGSTMLTGEEWFTDRRPRYLGWKTLDKYPLIALAGLDWADTMAPYWRNRVAAVRQGIAATIALVVFTVIAMVLSLRLAWRKYQLELSQATYRMATEGGQEGFYIMVPIYDDNQQPVDFKVSDCNHRGADMYRYRREELVGKTISNLYQGANPQRVISMLRQAMTTGFYENEWEVPADSPITAKWVHLKAVHTDGNLAVTLRDISAAKAHVVELERRSNEDNLTGLPNRNAAQAYLPKAIQQAIDTQTMLALLFIDLDGFKLINDTMGHEAGDEALHSAARRLKVAVRPHDFVARLGGDEFVVVLDNIASKEDAAHVADRIQHAFQDKFRLPQGVHSLGASIGISIFPQDGADSMTLLRNADIAMYAVKTSGKRHYRFYDERLYQALRTRLDKEAELRHAIEQDQFVMYYQPRVDMASGSTSSLEALVRWAHPTRGLIGPSDFIPLAEETGMILRLGELIIEKVCAQMAYWAGRQPPLVPVSINVSSHQFNEMDVATMFASALARHQLDPALIEIEVTESSMMSNTKDITQTLARIQKMGIKLLVDDFGTGYSSLAQLQQMDFDVLKVDRAFTSKLAHSEEGNIFFKAIITMAHALSMRVVAEGVENLEQIKILKSLGCDEIQGFYISKPLPAAADQPTLPQWHFPSVAPIL